MSHSTPGSARRWSYASVLSGAPAAPTAVPRSGYPPRPEPGSSSTPLSQSFPPQYLSAISGAGSAGYHTRPGEYPDQFEAHHLSPYANPYRHQGSDNLGAYPSDAHVSDFFVPTYLRGSRHMERLRERHRTKSIAQKEGRSARSSNAGSLSTSTSGVNLHKMVPSHRGMTHEIIERPFNKGQQDADLPELPTRWSATDKFAGIEVASDGSEAKFNGSPKTMDEGAAVRADHPIPRECGIYYYEIDVLSKGKESQIAVGFSGSKVVLNRMPGWEPDSWAYHGDDGNSFCQTASGKPYGLKFGSTDVVGCGINFRTGCAFFTRNGVHLGTAFRELKAETLYPAIGFKRANEQIRVNFGELPFVYDIDGLVEAEKQHVLDEIASEEVSPLQSHKSKDEPLLMQELVAQYLAHDGYIESAKAFAVEVSNNANLLRESKIHRLEYKEDPDAINRQRIRSAILSGDIDKALKYTNTFYPSVLQDNENIYFKLRCQKFIELMRRCNELQPHSKGKGKGKARRTSSTANINTGTANGHDRHMRGHNTSNVSLSSLDSLHNDDSALDADADHLNLDRNDDHDNNNDGNDMDIEPPSPHPDTFAAHQSLINSALTYGQELQSEFQTDPRREVKQALEDTFALIAYPDARQSSLAPLLEKGGRIPVAEGLDCAILVSLGKSSSAVLERLYSQTEVLVADLGRGGDAAGLVNPRSEYLSFP